MCPWWSPTPARGIMLLFYCNLGPQQQHLSPSSHTKTWDFFFFLRETGGCPSFFNGENRDSNVILLELLLGSLNPLHSLNSHREKNLEESSVT